MSALTKGELTRKVFCRNDPICKTTCGRCRVKAHRTWTISNNITGEEFEAALEAIPVHTRLTWGRIGRYVHEALRRRNSSYEGDTKLCIRMSQADLEMAKANAERAGLTLQEYGFAALAIAEPRVVAETWEKAFPKAKSARKHVTST